MKAAANTTKETTMTDNQVMEHDCFTSACQNVADEIGHWPRNTDENAEQDALAVAQARDLIEAGECGCCEGSQG